MLALFYKKKVAATIAFNYLIKKKSFEGLLVFDPMVATSNGCDMPWRGALDLVYFGDEQP